jgi:hypothetical protein
MVNKINNKMKMRKLAFILSIFLFNTGYTQINLIKFNYSNYNFIKVDLENLTNMLNSDLVNCESVLYKNEYKKFSSENNINVYTNGEMWSVFQSISKDTVLNVIGIKWYDFKKKKSIMTEVENILKDNYISTNESNIKFYKVVYNNKKYIIGLKRNPEYGMEEIFIRKDN